MDSVYRERAHLVAHLAAVYRSTIGYHDPAEPDWAVVIVDLPTGQASWHVSPDDMDLFRHVRRADVNTWDGHSTEEKYQRLDRATEAASAARDGLRMYPGA
jgi:hypothetical protein